MSEVFFVQIVGTNLGKCEWVWEEKLRWLNQRWWNSSWQNSRWLPSSSWVKMNEWSIFCANCGNQSWQVWVSLRGKTKMVESRDWQNSRWLPSSSWVRMNEWSIFCANGGNQSWQVWVSLRKQAKMDESKMAIFKMAVFNDGCHHLVKWEWMSLSQIELVWVRVRVEGVSLFLSESERR